MFQVNSTRGIGKFIPSVLRALYIVSIFLSVLQFGSVRPFPVTISAIFASAVALMSLIAFGTPTRARWLFVTVLVLGSATLAWIWMQASQSLPASFSNSLWADLPLASLAASPSISIVPADTMESLTYVSVPLLAFLNGLVLIRSDDDARKIINALAIGGAVCALYGLIQFSFFPTTNLFFTKQYYLDSLTATFVNRNTAGTFLGLAALVMLRYAWSLGTQVSIGKVVRHLLQNKTFDRRGLTKFGLIAFLFICAILALMLTKSRGAMASSFVAIAIIAYFLFVKKGGALRAGFSAPRSTSANLLRIALVLIAVVLAAVTFGGRTLMRAESQGTDDGRYCVLPGIIELAKGEPVFGYGAGTFLYSFTPYREPDCGLGVIWDRAHNTFIEWYIGLGLIFPIVAIIGTSAVMIAHIIGIRERRKMKSYSVMGLAGIILLGLHSLVDFSLTTAGMASYAAGLLAATSSISLAKSSSSGRSQSLRMMSSY